jgi:hypothetical protein
LTQTKHNILLNSTCNLSPPTSALISSPYSLRVILLIKSHLLLVSAIVALLDFALNTFHTFLSLLVADLASFLPLTSAMLNVLLALGRLRMLSRSPMLFKMSSTNLSLLKLLVAILKPMG